MRAVVDPGVLIAAAISRTHGSASVELVRQWRRGRFDVVASDRLVAEFAAVAQRPWFRERVSGQQADRLVVDLRQRAVVVGEPENVWPVSRDPDDDYLVAVARSTAADVLVSGDRDLTELSAWPTWRSLPRECFSSSSQTPVDGPPTGDGYGFSEGTVRGGDDLDGAGGEQKANGVGGAHGPGVDPG